MLPTMAPVFTELHAELPRIPWLTKVGETRPIALPLAYRFAKDAAGATTLASGEEWQNWTLERRNDLTAFLAGRAPARDADWNPIAGMVRDIVENDVLPRAAPRLGVLPMARSLVGWDVANSLMEAAVLDCRRPVFFAHLMEVYRTGQLPVAGTPSAKAWWSTDRPSASDGEAAHRALAGASTRYREPAKVLGNFGNS